MQFIQLDKQLIAYRDTGPRTAPAVLLGHPLGMNQSVWDAVVGAFATRLRLVTWDLPGHGFSAPASGPVTAADLAHQALGLLDALNIDQAHFVGTSIGGVIGQALLLEAPKHLREVVLTNTGAVIGTPEGWHKRAAQVRGEGLHSMAPAVVDRWFGPTFKAKHPAAVEGWQIALARCDGESYARLCELLAAADFRKQLKGVDKTVHVAAGGDDCAAPLDIVKALSAEFDHVSFETLEGVGHVPSVEAPERFAAWLSAIVLPPANLPPTYADGLVVRKQVLGVEHVARSESKATAFDAPFQNMITRLAWGELWANPDLSRRERSMITIAVLAALGRDGELQLHLEAAKGTGVRPADLRQALMHVAIYGGVPAANHAFGLARQHGWGDIEDTG